MYYEVKTMIPENNIVSGKAPFFNLKALIVFLFLQKTCCRYSLEMDTPSGAMESACAATQNAYLPDSEYSLTWNVLNRDGVFHHYNILKCSQIHVRLAQSRISISFFFFLDTRVWQLRIQPF